MHPKQVTNIIIQNIIASLEHKIEQFQQSVKMGKMSGWFGHHMKWKGEGTFDAYLVFIPPWVSPKTNLQVNSHE